MRSRSAAMALGLGLHHFLLTCFVEPLRNLYRFVQPWELPGMIDTPFEKAPSSRPAFDREMLLDQAGHDPELLQTILEVFLDEAPGQIETLKASIEGRDPGTVAEEGHSLKGAAAAAAAVTVQELAQGIEMAGKASKIEEARALFDKLELEFQRFKEEAAR